LDPRALVDALVPWEPLGLVESEVLLVLRVALVPVASAGVLVPEGVWEPLASKGLSVPEATLVLPAPRVLPARMEQGAGEVFQDARGHRV